VSNGEYLDAVNELLEHDVIRELVHWQSTRRSSHERNPRTGGRKSFDEFESAFDFRDESLSDFGVPLAIPRSGLAKISAR
jgi:hypothetical protein